MCVSLWTKAVERSEGRRRGPVPASRPELPVGLSHRSGGGGPFSLRRPGAPGMRNRPKPLRQAGLIGCIAPASFAHTQPRPPSPAMDCVALCRAHTALSRPPEMGCIAPASFAHTLGRCPLGGAAPGETIPSPPTLAQTYPPSPLPLAAKNELCARFHTDWGMAQHSPTPVSRALTQPLSAVP
jgi:hypothetical protein